MSDKNEIDRLERLREQQLRARDPKKKDRQQARMISEKYRRRKKLTLGDIVKEIRGGWWGILVGGLVGAALGLLLQRQLDTSSLVLYLLILIGIVVGRVVGMVADWREEDYSRLGRGR